MLRRAGAPGRARDPRRVPRRPLAVVVSALAAAAAIALAACGDGSTEPKTPVGLYTLATINGKAPPVTMFSDTGFMVVVPSWTMNVQADGKFSSILTSQWTVDGNASVYVDTATGTWTQPASGQLQLRSDDDGSTRSATWGAGRLTVTDTMSDFGVTTIVYTRK